MKNISVKEFNQEMKKSRDNLEVVDVREVDEYEEVHIKGSKHIPLGELIKRGDEIDWAKKIVLICRSGARSSYAAELMAANGHAGKEICNLDGGILALQTAGCDCIEK